jgi:hypothetical protein
LIRIGFWSRSWSRLHFQNRDPVAKWKSITDFSGTVFDRDRDRDCSFKTGIRLRNENRRSILRSKSLIDFPMKIRIRFHVPSVFAGPEPVFNRDPICRSKSQIDFTGKIGIRLWNENRSLIFPERFSIAIAIAIAVSKPGPGCEMIFFWNHSSSL